MDCEYLIGKKILDFALFETDKGIVFKLENENVYMECEGSCCSDGWVEHIENGEYLKDAIVLECEEISNGRLQYNDPRSSKNEINSQEVEKIYFLKIKTNKGYVDIDYRNSSNGYYGTELNWHSDK